VLGPPLGHAFLEPDPVRFWRHAWRNPEPVEHGRYLVALAGAALLAAVLVALARRPLALRPATARALTLAAQVLALALLAASLLAQSNVIWRSYNATAPARNSIFTPATIAVALALALLAPVLLRRRRELAARIARNALRETRLRRLACLALAAALTALWLLTAVNTDGSAGHAQVLTLIPWTMNETFAVLDGRTPLVNFHAEYAQLWPYPVAAAMALLGTSVGVWTTTMATISGVALLAIYAMLRRIVRSSLLALAVYVPFVATGFFVGIKPLENRFSPAGVFSAWPLRYAGPYLLAWLMARHVDRLAPRRAGLLLLAAGLVVLNNPELGVPAWAATLAALALISSRPWSWRALGRLFASAAAGLLGACLLVSLLTLVRAGALPRFGLLLEFPRLYGVDGWTLQRMPMLGFHVAMYATFVAAIAVAVVRATSEGHDEREDKAEQRVLSAMLAWSGAFGLLAGSFYVGRSEVLQLLVLMSAWCLALVLLLVVVVRRLAARGWRRPELAELAVLFGFGLAICSLAQIPTPWSQVTRLGHTTRVAFFGRRDAERFVRSVTAKGERVAIIAPLGHRIAYDLGLVNVSPYSGVESMPAVEQAQDTIALLARNHVHQVFLSIFDRSPGDVLDELAGAFVHAGYSVGPLRAGVIELTNVPAFR
jgi:hypothetical protein